MVDDRHSKKYEKMILDNLSGFICHFYDGVDQEDYCPLKNNLNPEVFRFK